MSVFRLGIGDSILLYRQEDTVHSVYDYDVV